ncbi:MAG: bifunctional phosphoribosylaminoimidazolecarboxamide formyltransferase/IMP cyclohydrolase [Synergistetes bacterium]|nr:bifunctional phosphoribosylaminoimidazolecarboxamide formyltransferase/IMP cyclohydrolase [Synergistota bacterium]MCX8128123.1 bifunctional phosphoribosylaminoimidazolecarboxamide formyltransferase/IMP cyclohydrolase [Synergistota bacterium]MDW8192499.1 bifunctional phosphoribosylaminoimidazolecarboxamide formyltransferase/IMP cyclohydrolase [Synergistota bacterium]
MLEGIKRALFALSDKSDSESFVKFLLERNIEVYATEGTASYLEKNGLKVKRLSLLTGFSDKCGGRVKTLNEEIFSRILCRPGDPEFKEKFDMVVVDLYPFKNFKSIENIDIGGVSLLRAAAKNYEHVIVICDKRDYKNIMKTLSEKENLSFEERKFLAFKAFRKTMIYDFEISLWLSPESGVMPLRYGENPHQKGFFYSLSDGMPFHYQGDKPLSFNNILDAYRAWLLVNEFREPACAIIKHASPCGVAISKNPEETFIKAFECDPTSAYGGIVAFNFPITTDILKLMENKFFDLIVIPELPSFDLKKRFLVPKSWDLELDLKLAFSGILIQNPDKEFFLPNGISKDATFAFKVAKHLYSNAIVIAKDCTTVGLCGGQPSRIYAVKIALERARDKAKGGVLASDGFFPFPDSIEEAHRYEIKTIIAPKGSKKDEEVKKRADELGIELIFVEERHFRH